MTKDEVATEISNQTGVEKSVVKKTLEAFMQTVKSSVANGENVYLREFGSFIVKRREAKTARNISKNTAIQIPAHNIPFFKPSKRFAEMVKQSE